jgi:hypothetical protein
MLTEAFPRQRWTCFEGNRQKEISEILREPLKRCSLFRPPGPYLRRLSEGSAFRAVRVQSALRIQHPAFRRECNRQKRIIYCNWSVIKSGCNQKVLIKSNHPNYNPSFTWRVSPYTSQYIYLTFFFVILVCEAIGTAATPGLLCQPRVIVKMIIEKQMQCRLTRETEVLGENLPQRHFCPSQNPTWPDPDLNPGRRGGNIYFITFTFVKEASKDGKSPAWSLIIFLPSLILQIYEVPTLHISLYVGYIRMK